MFIKKDIVRNYRNKVSVSIVLCKCYTIYNTYEQMALYNEYLTEGLIKAVLIKNESFHMSVVHTSN